MDYVDSSGDFTVEVEGSIIKFNGNIQLENYDDLMYFLQKVDKEIQHKDVTYDLRKLQYLNSSGIRMLINILQESNKKINFEIDKDITWQRICLLTLNEIAK